MLDMLAVLVSLALASPLVAQEAARGAEVAPAAGAVQPAPAAPAAAAETDEHDGAGSGATTAPPVPSGGATAGGAAAPALAAAPAAPPDPLTLAQGEVVVVTRTGLHRFTVEIADDPVERAQGLMYRTEMEASHGMLFDFAVDGPRSFWMKNTLLPLDMIFAAADGRVVSIARNTVPHSLESVPSEGDARFVLELNAGVSERIGLAPGDRLLHRRIVR